MNKWKRIAKSIEMWHKETFPDMTEPMQRFKVYKEYREWKEAVPKSCDELFEAADVYISGVSYLRRFKGNCFMGEMLVKSWMKEVIGEADLSELYPAVNVKMLINRNRRWDKNGQHVRE